MSNSPHAHIWKRLTVFFMFSFLCTFAYSQSLTTVQGVVRDSVTHEVVAFAAVGFDGTTTGTSTGEDGRFRLNYRGNKTVVTVSLLGYKTKNITIRRGTTNNLEVFLAPDANMLNEVVVRPKKEKYSKKNNPAVELIKKVIAHKKENNITNLDYYQCEEYERIFFAFNEFNKDKAPFKRYKFLENYIDTSLIDSKLILPFSVREKLSDVYYRKDPKDKKRIVKGYHIQGLDQTFETAGLDAIITEVFKDISIFDNSSTLLFHQFVSPLSEHSSVNFYKWYLNDTVTIENDRYVQLDFAPFNSRDIGYTGHLYISLDSMYAVKRAILRAPKKMNINFVEELIIRHEFEKTSQGKWVPVEERMAIDLSMLDAVKFYIDKTRKYERFRVNEPMDPIFVLSDPEVYEKDYLKKTDEYWMANRPSSYKKDYRMDDMMKDINNVTLFKVLLNIGNIVSAGYIPTNKDPDLNKLDIGTVPTFYSYNRIEGNRFRLTAATTKNFHPHFYLYGYAAYGTKDSKFKYYGEATWSFRDVLRNKDEFPRNNLVLAYKYDMNSLGQRYMQAERDNILMSLNPSRNVRMTYNRQAQITYTKEYYNGFSFSIAGQTNEEKPAGSLLFEKRDEMGNLYHVDVLRSTEAKVSLRYAPNEKFFQQRRKRYSIPAPGFTLDLSHAIGFDGFLGGQNQYNRTAFSLFKEAWIAPYGKIAIDLRAEKIWGEVNFPHLITPSANSSYTIQRGTFYLMEPLEFMHDQQVSWEIYYHMGGLLFNRLPLLKHLKWREVFGFRGFLGSLSDDNNPLYNRDLLVFPQHSYTTAKGKPYMEYNIGIENIFNMFRIDYVRRINYLNHPDINKHGFRVTFELMF